MTDIAIVSHAWAGKYGHYAACLNYQLSAHLLYQPKCCVNYTVCWSPDDAHIGRVLEWFIRKMPLSLWTIELPIEKLGRRAIGRNIAAKRSEADIIWMTDTDHVMRNGCLDSLAALDWPVGASIVYPRNLMIHRDHATGDRLTSAFTEPAVLDIDESEFVPKQYTRAIGPAMIVRGDFARQYGYLDGDPYWQQPRTDGRPFGDFRDDIAFRRFCMQHGRMVGIDLPGIYRIRHSRTTYQ